MLAHRTNQESSRNQERDIALMVNSRTTSSNTRNQRYTAMMARNAGSPKMLCTICGKNNHSRADCRNRFNRNENDKPQQTQPSKRPRVKCTYCSYQNHVYKIVEPARDTNKRLLLPDFKNKISLLLIWQKDNSLNLTVKSLISNIPPRIITDN